jgi:cell division protease FtsH
MPKKRSSTSKKPTAQAPKKGQKVVPGPILPKSPFGNVFYYALAAIILYAVISAFSSYDPFIQEVPLSDVLYEIDNEKVQDVTVAGDTIEVLLRNGSTLIAEKESTISFDEILSNSNIDHAKISGKLNVEHRLKFEDILSPLIMIGFPILILVFIFRQMKSTSGDIMSFGKTKAKLFNKKLSKTTFKDVAGNDEAKREMVEIVDFLKHPKKYQDLGARLPKGVLLVGSSGVGKTLLAKAIAGEAGVPFFSVAGSEFMEMLVGVGSSRVRDLFKMARAGQPSLIFIDEIDAIGRQRGMGIGGGHDEREQTLNQILIEMDGFDERTNVIVLAATNRPDMLDPALVRPGRFDRRISIPLPDLKAREEIIKIHMRGKPFAKDFKVEQVAKKTVGFSGADIENMLNESAILAARDSRKSIKMTDLDEASLKVTMGSERKTLMSEEERKVTAYHEAGHALVAKFSKDSDPVARITIVARGGSLGHTYSPPERDRYNETKTRLISMITMALGGRAAEEIVFKETTIGASNDLSKANQLARKMVTEFGMSPLGPISYNGDGGQAWVARGFVEGPKQSEEMSAKIDAEANKIVSEAYKNAKKIVRAKRKTLDKVVKELLKKETLDGDEFLKIVNSK